MRKFRGDFTDVLLIAAAIICSTLGVLCLFALVATSARAAIQATDDQSACNNTDTAPLATLRADNSSVIRIAISPVHEGQAIQCVQQARAAGYRVYLTVSYDNQAPISQTVAYFQRMVREYGPVWAMSIGGEQSLNPGDGSPQQYRAVWDAVASVIPAGTIKVFADGAPWDENWIKAAWGSGAPGAGAIAYHCYDVSVWSNQLVPYVLNQAPEFSGWAASQGMPLWCSESVPWADPPPVLASVASYFALIDDYVWPSDGFLPGWAATSAPIRAQAGLPLLPGTHIVSVATSEIALRAAVSPPKTIRHHKATHRRHHHRRHLRRAYVHLKP